MARGLPRPASFAEVREVNGLRAGTRIPSKRRPTRSCSRARPARTAAGGSGRCGGEPQAAPPAVAIGVQEPPPRPAQPRPQPHSRPGSAPRGGSDLGLLAKARPAAEADPQWKRGLWRLQALKAGGSGAAQDAAALAAGGLLTASGPPSGGAPAAVRRAQSAGALAPAAARSPSRGAHRRGSCPATPAAAAPGAAPDFLSHIAAGAGVVLLGAAKPQQAAAAAAAGPAGPAPLRLRSPGKRPPAASWLSRGGPTSGADGPASGRAHPRRPASAAAASGSAEACPGRAPGPPGAPAAAWAAAAGPAARGRQEGTATVPEEVVLHIRPATAQCIGRGSGRPASLEGVMAWRQAEASARLAAACPWSRLPEGRHSSLAALAWKIEQEGHGMGEHTAASGRSAGTVAGQGEE